MKYIFFSFLCTATLIQSCENKHTIRPAQTSDRAQLNALSEKQYQKDFKPLWQNFYAASFPHINVDTFIADITQRNNNRNEGIINKANTSDKTCLLVAETKDEKGIPKVAGFCRFEPQDEKTIYMQFILIDEDFRKQGIAKALALNAMQTFANAELCRFRAHVHNKKINEIYIQHGCKQVGEVSIDLETGKVCNNPDAPITHYEYVYTIQK